MAATAAEPLNLTRLIREVSQGLYEAKSDTGVEKTAIESDTETPSGMMGPGRQADFLSG